MWAATSCGMVYMRFSADTSAGTRGETRPGGELGGGKLPRGVDGGGEGGGGIVHTGGIRGMQDDMRPTGNGSGVTSIA